MASSSPLKNYRIDDDDDSMDGGLDEKPKKKLPDDINKWPLDIQAEILLAIMRRKPVGIDAHFRMIALMTDLYSPKTTSNKSESGGFQKHQSAVADYDITSTDVWKYLNNFYDISALNQTETPHPMSARAIRAARAERGDTNRDVFVEFYLPEPEYTALMQAKMAEQPKTATSATPTPAPTPVPPDSPPPSKKKKTKSVSRQSTAAIDDTESRSSSRSSTPASAAGALVPTPTPTPTTRRSRQRKD